MCLNPKNKVDSNWRELVADHFKTATLSEAPARNSIVSGVVVANAPTGIYLDLGCGIPAFLEIMCVDDSDKSMIPHWTKKHGVTLAVMVSHMAEDRLSVHQIDYQYWGPEFEFTTHIDK